MKTWQHHFTKKLSLVAGHWIWSGRFYQGTPVFGVNRDKYPELKNIGSARFFGYLLKNGELPNRRVIVTCDDARCVNPEHFKKEDHTDFQKCEQCGRFYKHLKAHVMARH